MTPPSVRSRTERAAGRMNDGRIPIPGFFQDMTMGIAKIVGTLLIVGGALGLAYGGFTYTKETHSAKLGPVVLQVQERETVYVPIILSAAAIGLGLILLVAFRSK